MDDVEIMLWGLSFQPGLQKLRGILKFSSALVADSMGIVGALLAIQPFHP